MGSYMSQDDEVGWEVEENLCSGFAQIFTIKSTNMIVKLCSYGGTLLSVRHRSSEGYKFEEITLNRPTSLDDLMDSKLNQKYGATCGRVAGRISNASFTIKDVKGKWYTSDQTYYLEKNNGTNCLHSGSVGQ